MGKTHFKCSIPVCESEYPNKENIRFFKFPLNALNKRKWIEILTKTFPAIEVGGNSRLCQLHFSDQQFSSTLKSRLRKFAYPDQMVIEVPLESLSTLGDRSSFSPLPSTSQAICPSTPPKTNAPAIYYCTPKKELHSKYL